MVVSQTMPNLDWPKSISRFEKWYKIIFQNWGWSLELDQTY